MDIGLLIPSTIPQVTTEVVDIGILIPATITQVITEDMLVEVDLGHNRPATLTPEIGEI